MVEHKDFFISVTVITVASRPLDLIPIGSEYGFITTAIVEDMDDDVFISLRDRDGDFDFFEGEARFLEDWCKSRHFDYYMYTTNILRVHEQLGDINNGKS
jgi:hypothetical protein